MSDVCYDHQAKHAGILRAKLDFQTVNVTSSLDSIYRIVDHVQVTQQQPSPLSNPNITSHLTSNITAVHNLTDDFAPSALYNVSGRVGSALNA